MIAQLAYEPFVDQGRVRIRDLFELGAGLRFQRSIGEHWICLSRLSLSW